MLELKNGNIFYMLILIHCVLLLPLYLWRKQNFPKINFLKK